MVGLVAIMDMIFRSQPRLFPLFWRAHLGSPVNLRAALILEAILEASLEAILVVRQVLRQQAG